MARVELRSLRKVYGSGVLAVRDIDLEIRDGEFMVLVGPSGCAKSTTLRMIAGLEEITAGQILIDGTEVNAVPPGKRGIAMVFQNYALYPHMDVAKNLSFGMRMARRPQGDIEAGVDKVSAVLQIEELLNRLPGQLSGGQAQRVAVGRALIKEPRVFLFDEPLSNLDAKLRASMRVRIIDLHRRLKAENKAATVVYVTHDQTEAMTMGDRICVMKLGEIMQVDTPRRLFERPRNTFVASFLGSPEMNIIKAQVSRQDRALRFADQTVHLDAEFVSRIGIDGPALFGVRAHHMELAAPDNPGALSVVLRHVEFMGNVIHLYAGLGNDEVVVSLDAEAVREVPEIGNTVTVAPRQSACHIFHPETEENVSLATETDAGRVNAA